MRQRHRITKSSCGGRCETAQYSILRALHGHRAASLRQSCGAVWGLMSKCSFGFCAYCSTSKVFYTYPHILLTAAMLVYAAVVSEYINIEALAIKAQAWGKRARQSEVELSIIIT